MQKVVRALTLCLLGMMLWGQTQKKSAASPKPPAAKPAVEAKPQKSALDKATLEAFLRHTFMLPDNLKVSISDPKPSEVPGLKLVAVTVISGENQKQNVEFFVSDDGTKIMQGKVFDVRESPFAADLKLLRTEGAPSTGPADAPVTMVVFSDFQCQFCREEAKTLRQNLAKDYPTQARLVFKDFPLEQIHPWAKTAAIAGRCVAKANAPVFWEYHDWIFEQQPQITLENVKAKILEFAGTKGLDTLQLTQCIDGKLTEGEVMFSSEEAKALQVSSTPTLFINGRRFVGNTPWPQVKQVIEYELNYSKKMQSEKKDEACCEVKLPIPVQK
jgi:protein-disulfide isomerase